MEYKATWKFSKDGDYTIDDRVFPIPSDYINTCIGEKQELTINRVCCDLPEEKGYDMPLDDDTCKRLGDVIDEWRKNMGLDIWKESGLSALNFVMDGETIGRIFKDGYFEIKEVIFHNPATVVYWKDGTKTIVTDMDNMVDGKAKPAESYSKETGLALCYMKKALGNKGNYNNAFREWVKED